MPSSPKKKCKPIARFNPKKKRTCKSSKCSERFLPPEDKPWVTWCSPECGTQIGLEKIEKQRKTREKQWKAAKKKKEQEEKEKIEGMRENITTKSDYAKRLQDEVNAIARLIDKGCTCISCDKHGVEQGGHYHSVQSNPSLRFNLHNIHMQEAQCNGDKGGNIIAYGRGLIERYGQEYRDYVEYEIVRQYPYIGLNRDDLKALIPIARAIKRELEKKGETYNPVARRMLRSFYNAQLGIYQ